MSGILSLHALVILYIVALFLHVKVHQLFKNKDYILNHPRQIKLANIRRYSIDGWVTRLLEFIKYLENRKNHTPDGICTYRYDLTHHGFCVLNEGFNYHMVICIFWHIINRLFSNIFTLIGVILGILALATADVGKECGPYLFNFEVGKMSECVVNHLPQFTD